MASIAVKSAVGVPRLRLRLRYLLAVGCVAFVAFWGVPRARSAWRLHDVAALYADYGLCMAGPTGATLLRDQPNEFWRLVRRRIVGAAADDRPFAGCVPIVAKLTASSSATDLHQSKASGFSEWGRSGAELNVSMLAHTLPDLAALADTAWPFLRNGVSVLIKPSLGAKEAIHPVACARPGALAGLKLNGSLLRARRTNDKGWFVVLSDAEGTRALRSRDRGHRWTATSPWQSSLEGTHERCSADASEGAFGLEQHRGTGGATIVYFDRGTRSGQSSIGEGLRVISLGCDDTAAVVATESGRGQLGLQLCAMNQPCRAMPAPPLLNDARGDGVDVARVQGVTVIALTQGELVRVVSTRDDGRMYTPFTVAFDNEENPFAPRLSLRPAQLLVIGNTLLLSEEAKTNSGVSAAVVSTDYGASWRTF